MPKKTISGAFQLTFYIPPPYNIRKLQGKLLAALRAEEREMTRLMNMTIENWADPPKMEATQRRYGDGTVAVEVQPTGTEKQVKKWRWLDKGTRVRYATMRGSFVRKTHPRRLTTNAGTSPSGKGVAFINTRIPHKGIKARQWSTIINGIMRRRFARNIQRAISEGLS